MLCQVTVLPAGITAAVEKGTALLEALRRWGHTVDAPCGGNGSCGKCTVLVDGVWVRACQYRVEKDISVTLAKKETPQVERSEAGETERICAAFDIGTTTLVGALMAHGKTFTASALNPQVSFGADVISRIQYAGKHGVESLHSAVVQCAQDLLDALCREAEIAPEEIETIALVGNSCMQQLFLGMDADNLASPPFDVKIRKTAVFDGKTFFPSCKNAKIITPGDIAGFVGGDLLAGIVASKILETRETALLVDIGTNGEMALCHKGRLVTCATAAGPALEGANISCGMRAAPGAIHHVTERGCTVLGGETARGICGSGLVDAVAALLKKGILNARGKFVTGEDSCHLRDGICLSQEDVRQVQSAKGAIAAGVELLCGHLGIGVEDIDRCILAGAFGSYLDADNACRMGLLPEQLRGKVVSAGNLALEGAKSLARDPDGDAWDAVSARAEYLDLSTLPAFPRAFAKNMRFREEAMLVVARECGFSEAVYVDVPGLNTHEAVRDACAADKCRAYGKNWTCPPYIGDLDQCREKLRSYKKGILLQTVGKLEKTIDTRGYARVEREHLQAFHKFAEKVRETDENALCLGSGGCRICEKCAYPDPCCFPKKACSSMEGYGLFVTQICRDSGVTYYHGEKTIAYCALVLFNY